MATACFISDLHLFANRSRADRFLEPIRQASDRADICVLGGDIFDFRWSTLPNEQATVEAAVEWLDDLTSRSRNSQIHFLLGNHDYNRAFIDRLPELADRHPNFQWHRFYLREGDAVFLHGDVADRKMTASKLEQRRERCLHHRPRGRFHSRAYDAVVHARAHLLVPRAVYPHRLVARRIMAYLQDIGEGPSAGVRQVCFGHTHLAMADYRYRGVAFHNGGAPIGSGRFRILDVTITH